MMSLRVEFQQLEYRDGTAWLLYGAPRARADLAIYIRQAFSRWWLTAPPPPLVERGGQRQLKAAVAATYLRW